VASRGCSSVDGVHFGFLGEVYLRYWYRVDLENSSSFFPPDHPHVSAFMQYLLNRGNYRLVQIRVERSREFNRQHSWLIRPLQCIGLAMLIAARFITVLQIYTGEAITTSTVLPPPHFSLERFLSITAIAMTTSLLLSFLWTLDDLGIRYSNRKSWSGKTGQVHKW